eukprot:gene34683-24946_t
MRALRKFTAHIRPPRRCRTLIAARPQPPKACHESERGFVVLFTTVISTSASFFGGYIMYLESLSSLTNTVAEISAAEIAGLAQHDHRQSNLIQMREWSLQAKRYFLSQLLGQDTILGLGVILLPNASALDWAPSWTETNF